MNLKIDHKKIGRFLKPLGEAEFRYVKHIVEIRESIECMIRRHKLTKSDFCKRMAIPHKKYEDFVKGNFNYSVMHLSRVNAYFMELETEKLKDKAPFQVKKSDSAKK